MAHDGSMRILFLTQYYPPETGAPQNRLSDLARRLKEKHHHITILTALPNYPSGQVFSGYEGRLVVEEEIQGVRVLRTWVYASLRKTFVSRLLNYFSFVVTSVLYGIGRIGRQDIVFVESPPLFLGLSGILLCWIKGAQLIFNVSDLWPASAVALGMVNNKLLIRIAEGLEMMCYQRAALITGQTQGIVDDIRARCPGKVVRLLPNGVDLDRFPSTVEMTMRQEAKHKFSYADKFVVGFLGLHGLAQGLETVVQAAEKLGTYEDILFAFFGDGPEREGLLHFAEERRIRNVRFFPSHPSFRVPEILTSFDVGIAHLKRNKLFLGAIPAKTYEFMAAGIPVIIAVDGEARKLIVDQAQAGLFAESENPEALAEEVLHLYRDLRLRKMLGDNGRRFVRQHFDRSQLAAQFERWLRALQEENQGSRPVE